MSAEAFSHYHTGAEWPDITSPLFDEERKAMQFWISHQKEYMTSLEKPYDPNDPNFNLLALINAANTYRHGMTPVCIEHMQRMVAIEATRYSDVKDEFLKSNIEQVLAKKLVEVRRFAEDLSDAPEQWRLAYSDLMISHRSEDVTLE